MKTLKQVLEELRADKSFDAASIMKQFRALSNEEQEELIVFALMNHAAIFHAIGYKR